MSYTDRDYQLFSAIAADDSISEAFDNTKRFVKPPIKFADLADIGGLDLKSVFEKYKVSPYELERISEWSISDIENNTDSGFFGCVIETAPNSATIAFRGTNSLVDTVTGDADLWNSEITIQQSNTEEYLKKLQEKGFLDKFETIDFTGHSLGGNLAKHAAVVLTKMGYENKLNRAVSLDGPGCSDEYYRLNQDVLERIHGKITQYTWSMVGRIFKEYKQDQPDGVKRQAIKIRDASPLDLKYHVLQPWGKHGLENMTFDSHYNVESDPFPFDPIQGLTYVITNLAENPSEIISTPVYGLAEGMLNAGGNLLNMGYEMAVSDSGNLFVDVMSFLGGTLIGGVGLTLSLAGCFVGLVGSILDFGLNVLEWAVGQIAKHLGYIGQALSAFVGAAIKAFSDFFDWLGNLFDSSDEYVDENPEMIIDTGKLINYASELRKLNGRINRVMGRIIDLYIRCGLVDLNRMKEKQSHVIPRRASIQLCAEYLEEVAHKVVEVENNIGKSIQGGK